MSRALATLARVRSAAEERAALQLGQAVGSRRLREEEVGRAERAWSAVPAPAGAGGSVASLQLAASHHHRLAMTLEALRRSLEESRRVEEAARAAHVEARRGTRALAMAHERELQRERRRRQEALEEELSEAALLVVRARRA